MILVDTSVWVGHLRQGNPRLANLLENEEVLCHPFVIGELALGNLSARKEIIEALQALPGAKKATDTEVLRFVEDWNLWGKGVGWVDAHLLVSARLSASELWTVDRRLGKVIEDSRLFEP